MIVDLGEPSVLSHAERLVMRRVARRSCGRVPACTYTATRGSFIQQHTCELGCSSVLEFFSLWMEYVTVSNWCDSEIMEEVFETFKRDRCAFDSSFVFLDGFPARARTCAHPKQELYITVLIPAEI